MFSCQQPRPSGGRSDPRLRWPRLREVRLSRSQVSLTRPCDSSLWTRDTLWSGSREGRIALRGNELPEEASAGLPPSSKGTQDENEPVLAASARGCLQEAVQGVWQSS